MTETLEAFAPDAPETLKIAARAQHIERWTVPRNSYPEGRVAYLTWRKDLQKMHARRAGEIMAQCGYSEDEIARTGSLLRKERLKQDPDAQTLEDVICLVFLAHEADAFIAKHDDDKVRDILAKTAQFTLITFSEIPESGSSVGQCLQRGAHIGGCHALHRGQPGRQGLQGVADQQGGRRALHPRQAGGRVLRQGVPLLRSRRRSARGPGRSAAGW